MDVHQQNFVTYQAELFKRQLSNCENFDKAILTYASGALALSLGFLKDFVPLNKAAASVLLHLSWAAFAACIVVTVASYLISQQAIKRQLKIAERYYIKREENAFSEPNLAAHATEWCNIASGVLFCGAVVLTTIFVSLNAKVTRMSNKIDQEYIQKISSGEVPTIKAAVIPPMVSVPVAIPASTTATPTPVSAPTTSQGGGSTDK
ncbi:hypothetical protein EX530_20205 [Xanthomonas phaseoli]|uniref:hypothetical protein n=1 Tax=Xanthomonas phaseoli TaxID=1985254 RepID=UPI003B00A55F